MKNQNSIPRSILRAFSILALVQGLAMNVFAQFPAGDLTVTVQELVGGEVRFTLAGSAPLRAAGNFYNTGFDSETNTPPHTRTEQSNFTLPAGLTLSAGGSDIPLNYVYFYPNRYWVLGTFLSAFFPEETHVSGRGTGTSSTIPFSHFVPGTYVVRGGEFDVTYRVLPIAAPVPAPPRLSVQKPSRFATTKVGRRSRAKSVRISNLGGTTATGISVRTSGRASRDYLLTRPLATLAPGGSALFKVTFRPRSKGLRRATATVRAANADSSSVPLLGRGK